MRLAGLIGGACLLLALGIGAGATAPAAEAAPPACSLPQLSQDKLDAGARRVALYRKRRKIEFSPELQGFAKIRNFGPIDEREEGLIVGSVLVRAIFGLNTNIRLIRGVIRASRRGSPRIRYLLGLPFTKLEKRMIAFTVAAMVHAGRLDLYGKACAPGYAGYWSHSFLTRAPLGFTVRFKQDREEHREALRRQFAFWPLLKFLGARYSLNELNIVNRQIGRDRGQFRRRGIRILLRQVDPEINAIQVLGFARRPRGAQRFFARRYGDAVEALFLPGLVARGLKRQRLERRAKRLRARVARELAKSPARRR